MIEVIYKDEKTTAEEGANSFSIPRNIRQVGLVRENVRIYMEDYVYTFLKKLSEGRDNIPGHGRLAILKGETHWKDEITYVFIRGAVLAGAKESSAERIAWSDEDWENIHREEGQYFPDEETVGWFFTEPDIPLQINSVLDSIHMKYFGADKICMLMDPTEKEEAFFHYENNNLIRLCGYYLYYEKNPQMQTYMIDRKQELAAPDFLEIDPGDEAVQAFRKRVEEKKEGNQKDSTRTRGSTLFSHRAGGETEASAEKEPTGTSGGFLSYAATACLAVAVLAAGVNFYRNYQRIEQRDIRTQTVSSTAITPRPSLSPTIMPTLIPSPIPTEPPLPTETVSTLAQEDAEKPVAGTQTETGNTSDEIMHEEADAANTQQAAGSSYVIRPGDTLFQISMERYGNLNKLEEICELNGISPNELIYPGQIIVLP